MDILYKMLMQIKDRNYSILSFVYIILISIFSSGLFIFIIKRVINMREKIIKEIISPLLGKPIIIKNKVNYFGGIPYNQDEGIYYGLEYIIKSKTFDIDLWNWENLKMENRLLVEKIPLKIKNRIEEYNQIYNDKTSVETIQQKAKELKHLLYLYIKYPVSWRLRR